MHALRLKYKGDIQTPRSNTKWLQDIHSIVLLKSFSLFIASVTCNPVTQFACGNGHCIPKRWVCDRDTDCNNAADEPKDCGMFGGAVIFCLDMPSWLVLLPT